MLEFSATSSPILRKLFLGSSSNMSLDCAFPTTSNNSGIDADRSALIISLPSSGFPVVCASVVLTFSSSEHLVVEDLLFLCRHLCFFSEKLVDLQSIDEENDGFLTKK